ncbi:MAG: hypothetical protein NTZ35_17325 [Ignavibacteriales bacterium]|nr:hypothetical protein [Ignavibacteriales bacterium]
MIKALLVCGTILFLGGCERLPDPPLAPASSSAPAGQILIIHGFGNADTASVGNEGYRVGWYFDFKDYDSLRINFSAKRLAFGSSVDHILIKVGPACYISDSLSASQKDFSLFIKPAAIPKSQFAALVFIVPDADATLLLSQLRVIGWAMH